MKTIDKNTVLTTIFTIVDDLLKDPKIQKLLHRTSGPEPEMTDSEVISVAVYEELIGDPREDHFYRLHEQELKPFFPHLLERSRYNRRKRDLGQIILVVRMCLLMIIKASEPAQERQVGFIDSAPVTSYFLQKEQNSY